MKVPSMRDYNSILFRSPKDKQQTIIHQNAQFHPKRAPTSSPFDSGKHGRAEPSSTSARESRQEGPTSIASRNTFSADSYPKPTELFVTQQPQHHIQKQSIDTVEVQQSALAVPETGQRSPESVTMKDENTEATIAKLRTALDEATNQDATAKTSLAKSDAIILELRSSVRQLKRQLEKLQQDKEEIEQEKEEMMRKITRWNASKDDGLDMTTKNVIDSHARDSRIGELQVQLDRAHAQILTADMVRKELEDTLEAEQYTWELRVQEQDRAIREWQDQCRTLQTDLEQCRNQWKDAEAGWTKEVEELQSRLEKAQQEAAHWKNLQTNATSSTSETIQLKEKLLMLEQERTELQSCLDDALKELEAVDAELQNDNSIQLREENLRLQQLVESRERDNHHSLAEPLQHLYRWLLERDEPTEDNGSDNNRTSRNIHDIPADPKDVLSAIQSHLENMPSEIHDLSATKNQVKALESQLSVYRGDLKAREESSAELMASLKEAVALLKPLQDASAKADRERKKLLDQLEKAQSSNDKSYEEIKSLKREVNEKDDEIEDLRQRLEALQLELSKLKLAAASDLINKNKNITPLNSPDNLSKAREDVRSRRQSEAALREMLRDAQTKLQSLHDRNNQVESMNSELQGRLRQAQESKEKYYSMSNDNGTAVTDSRSLLPSPRQSDVQHANESAGNIQGKVIVLEKEIQEKDDEIRRLEHELKIAKENGLTFENAGLKVNMQDLQQKVLRLDAELTKAKKSIASKKEAEKTLKKSLKDALALLKPLQIHLENSEAEKRELTKELSRLKTNDGDNSDTLGQPSFLSQSEANARQVRSLEHTVRQLEKENSQLHDALEDMSQSLNASHVSTFSAKSSPFRQLSNSKEASRLREELVEVKSRYEVTLEKLESTTDENQALIESLNNRDTEGEKLNSELHSLREKLRFTERELENAKYIATSALIKVEELTMANVEQLSFTNSTFVDQDKLYEEKIKELRNNDSSKNWIKRTNFS